MVAENTFSVSVNASGLASELLSGDVSRPTKPFKTDNEANDIFVAFHSMRLHKADRAPEEDLRNNNDCILFAQYWARLT